MAVDDGEFQFDFSADEEQLLIQLAADAEAKDAVAGAIDALPARSDFGPETIEKNDVSPTSGINIPAADEADAAAAALLLSAVGQIRSPICRYPSRNLGLPAWSWKTD